MKSSVEGAKRKLARPAQPKEPLSTDTVQAIVDAYVASDSLSDVRFLFILLVGFYEFSRVDKINSLILKDVAINGDHMKILVAKGKNDQYREGHTFYLSNSAKSTRRVATTEKLFPQLSDSEYPLVRRIVKAKSRKYFHSRGFFNCAKRWFSKVHRNFRGRCFEVLCA